MTIRPLFVATMIAFAALQQGLEIGAAENAYLGTVRSVTHPTGPAPKRLPHGAISALGVATSVIRIDDAFPATNQPGRIRSQPTATAKSRDLQTRKVALPSSAALAVVAAAEPRPDAPAMKPFVDSQVMAASYSAPLHSTKSNDMTRTETTQNSENPLRETGPTGFHMRSTISGVPSQNATNPLR